MSRFALATLIALSTGFAGCAASQKPAPLYLSGADYARVCRHPSMTRAAFREAFACHRPDLAALVADSAQSHLAQRGRAPFGVPQSTWVASADLAASQ